MKCAKCEIDEGVVHMGQDSYGDNHPMLCRKCRREWGKVCDYLEGEYGIHILVTHWKEKFEEWIGYKWRGSPERIVFS